MLREGLLKITSEYLIAKQEDLVGHPLARFIRDEFPNDIKSILDDTEASRYLSTEGTKFIGSWAVVPWTAVLDNRISTSPRKGLYVAYLFSENMKCIYLSLGVGVTTSSPKECEKVLKSIQLNFRPPHGFNLGPLSPGTLTTHGLGARYNYAVVFFKEYKSENLPPSELLIGDLKSVVNLLQEIAISGQYNSTSDDQQTQEKEFTIQGERFSFTHNDVKDAFAKTVENQWKDKAGIEPYWHLVIDKESKPIKAVFRNLPNVPKDFEFISYQAKNVFEALGFEVVDRRKTYAGKTLSLIGTWREASASYKHVQDTISERGGWASWWSFTLKDEPSKNLIIPFYIYINTGRGTFSYRMKVKDFKSSKGNEGILSPWPELTDEDCVNKTRFSDKQSEIFKTWLKVVDIEELNPPLTLSEMEAASPWSDSTNILNQNTFGYAHVKEPARLFKDPEILYSINDALSNLFMDKIQFSHIVDLLKIKKNLIIQGPPGTGKTFLAKRLAYTLIGCKDPLRIEMIQFHQSYSYEDFIQGYRPTDNGTFELKNGVFYEFCQRAVKEPTKSYIFIIDEINRGNLSKIFGEIMMLIETDKRGPEWAIPLTYAKTNDPNFYVPENVYLIGMMNTADRSLAMVDYALRRRFSFVDLKPAFDHPEFSNYLKKNGGSEALIDRIKMRMNELNQEIEEDRDLGPGFCIGHSFFCPLSEHKQSLDDNWYTRIIDTEIAPLIREYWFDKTKDEQEAIVRKLLRGI